MTTPGYNDISDFRYNGYLKAFEVHACTSHYIRPVQFGDSNFQHAGGTNDCHYGYHVEINITACCK